jgi:hypothetical protein
VANVTSIRNVLDRETDPDWKIGSKLLPAFVMQAMESDSRFNIELTLLRRTKPYPDIDHILSSLGVRARTLKSPQLSAHIAGAPPPQPPNAPANQRTPSATIGGLEVCRHYATRQACRYERPKQGLWCRMSHGSVAIDKKRMEAKKDYQSKKQNKKQEATKSATTDACYRCGSKNHGIDDCTETVQANIATYNPPKSGAFNDMATAVAEKILQSKNAYPNAPTALTATAALTTTADPLGVGTTNTAGIPDHADLNRALAQLFNGTN